MNMISHPMKDGSKINEGFRRYYVWLGVLTHC